MIKQLKYQRLLAMLYLGMALGIVYFWWQFFNATLFTMSDLSLLMPHFEAYYLWACSFVLPELILSVAMLSAAFFLWTNRRLYKTRLLSAACAGAALFQGVLGLSYGFSSGLYRLQHSFAEVALEADLSITIIAIVAIVIQFRLPRQDA
jgi:hypothetical protein